MGSVGSLPGVGERVAEKYLVEGVLGEGGMGVVLSATHVALRQKVAIKFLTGDAIDATSRARFLREARAAAQIQNEHVVRVLDVDELPDGTPYIVMEHLSGKDLDDVVAARGPLPVDEAVDYLLQASEAIAEAHAAGIVHRDLKPANLFVATKKDGSRTVKVLDFGISKEMAPAEGSLTATAQAIGSPFYMSPEQVRSSKNVDQRTDVWALGAILHQLLTGQTPFHGETLGQVYAAIIGDPPPPIRAARADVPPELDAIVARCLEKDVDKRTASVADMARALLPFSPASASSVARITTLSAPSEREQVALASTQESSSLRTRPLALDATALAPAVAESASRPEQPTPARTADSWAQTRPSAEGPKRGVPWVGVAIGAVVLLAAVFAGNFALRGQEKSHPASSVPSAEIKVAPVAASVAPVAPASAPATSVVPLASSVSALAPPSASAKPAAKPTARPTVTTKPIDTSNEAFDDRK